jgi:hypothetical protein
MSDPWSGPRPWKRLLIGAVLVGVVAVVVWLVAFGPSGYERLAERVGPQQAEHMLYVVIPVALAKHCHDSYGEDEALVQAVAEYIVRNQPAIAEIKEGENGVDSMSDDEKADLEEEAMSRVADMAGSAEACREATARITAGAFDV